MRADGTEVAPAACGKTAEACIRNGEAVRTGETATRARSGEAVAAALKGKAAAAPETTCTAALGGEAAARAVAAAKDSSLCWVASAAAPGAMDTEEKKKGTSLPPLPLPLPLPSSLKLLLLLLLPPRGRP